jgi:mannose-6-phosphate isomerase-like protein (cupin superfamily)
MTTTDVTLDDQGGDPPCWAHLFDEDVCEPANRGTGNVTIGPVVVDLGSARTGSGGVVWSLPHGGDLDANLVRLDAGAGIGAHVNNDVDVLVFVQSGSGQLMINGTAQPFGPDCLALIPRGTSRSITAASSGITYLSVHRRRSPLGISGPAERDPA